MNDQTPDEIIARLLADLQKEIKSALGHWGETCDREAVSQALENFWENLTTASPIKDIAGEEALKRMTS